MAVTFDANATADATANAVTSITTSNLTIGSGANRALVVQACLSDKTTTANAMNWDQLGTPTALTLIIGANGTGTVARAEVWGLVNPVSGAKQLKYSWTGSSDVCINGVSWTGVDQTGGATSFPHGTSTTGTVTNGAVSLTVTSATGNATMTAFNSDGGNFSAPTQTQSFIDNTPASMSTAGSRAAGAATVAHGFTLAAGSPVHWAATGTDILAFSGGAAVFVPRNTYQQTILTQ